MNVQQLPKPRRGPFMPTPGQTKRAEIGGLTVDVNAAGVPLWIAALHRAGLPRNVLVLDFETYHDANYHMGNDATALSMAEYIADPRFEVLGLVVLDVEDPMQDIKASARFWREHEIREGLEALRAKYGRDLERCVVLMHNAKFDATVLKRYYGLEPRHILDTMDLSRHWQARLPSHGLKKLAERFGLQAKGNTADFKGMTARTDRIITRKVRKGRKQYDVPGRATPATEQQWADLARYGTGDAIITWGLFTHLMPRLSNARVEVKVMRQNLDLFLSPVFEVDYELADKIKREMSEIAQKALDEAGIDEATARSMEWDELVAEALGDQAHQFKKHAKNTKRGWKIAAAKSDPEREMLENHPDPRVSSLMAARAAIDSWPNHISRINRLVSQARACGGKIPVPLLYYGSWTGRFSGAEKLNLQNLGSRGHPLVSAIRGLLRAPEGHKLVIVDLAAIEARVVAWLAGEQELLTQFANNEDVYCYLAEKLYGVPVRKPLPTDPEPVQRRLKQMRYEGKVGVLGGGYGMGPSGMSEQFGIPFDSAERIIRVYRTENRKIVGYWYEVERAFTHVVQRRAERNLANGVVIRPGRDCDVVIVLPSGRELKYQKARALGEGRYTRLEVYNEKNKCWMNTYGGSLVENITQAVARDILTDASLRLQERGKRCVLTVHDEWVGCVPEAEATETLSLAITEMSRTPAWAPGLPLNAEGVITDRYGNH